MNRLDDIIPPSRRKNEPPAPGMPATLPPAQPPRPRSRFPFFTLAVIIIITVICVGALWYFSSAKVELTPNSIAATAQGTFTADQTSGALPFQIITATKTESESVAETGTEAVSSPASGKITVYNTQSAAQKLITNTRFATASGLVFRIHAAITIPAGSASNPGSVVATAYADQPGANYNVGPSSFTVPGLAGTPIANDIYARSTMAMTGGASGTVPTVDSATESQTTQSLIDALGPAVSSMLAGQVPAGYVLVPGSATTTFNELTPSAASSTGMVSIQEQGTATAVVFPNGALADAIATAMPAPDYNGEPLTMPSASDLALTPVGDLPATGDTTFTFTLSGSTELVYSIDPSQISAAVAGKTRAQAEVALTSFPAVKQAILILRPFWRQSFPEDPTAISISVGNP